jgi:HAE1 family hydrophobic/amphiphilic exporter-1
LIVTFTIPISIMATFALMYFSGVSINMMSLGGLAFGVGSLVDAAIVVIENIFTHRQRGLDPKEAAIIGAQEVAVAVAGSVLTTVVVFLPLIFVIGITGQILKDFALTVTFSLMVSWLAAITIIPLLASGGHIDLSHEEPKAVQALRGFYSKLVQRFIDKKSRYLSLTLVMFLSSLLIFVFLDKELMPKVDQSQFIMKLDMPAGTRLTVTNSVAAKVEKAVMALPETESVNVTVGSTQDASTRNVLERLNSNQAEIIVNLKSKRRLKSADIVQLIKGRLSLANLEGARIEYVLQENVLASGMQAQAPLAVEIKGNELKELTDLTAEVQKALSGIRGVYGIKNDLAEPSPEVKIHIDKDKASIYGLSVSDIAQTAIIALKGSATSKFKEKGQEYDIRVKLREKDRDNFSKLSTLQLQSPAGVSVPLGSVATFGRGKGPSEIKRINQERVVYVYANIYDRPLKDVYADANNAIKKVNIPKNYIVRLAGESEEMKASFGSLRNAIIAIVLLVYMVMAALFESLWQPFLIMFTIPLSLIGVALGLFATGTSISVYVLIGVGILGGIVVDNAIVLMDYVNLLRSRGMSERDAAKQASSARLRAILMTALATVLGLVPMAFLGGEGAELRRPMAITVMSGLLAATFLTIVVIPAIYLASSEFFSKLFRRKG